VKVATWNVNSIRTRLPTVTDWLIQAGADVVCLQEIKVITEEFPTGALEALGYQVAVSGQKTYNGVAIASRWDLHDIRAGFPHYEARGEKRLISATVGGVRIVNVYIPNGSAPDSPKFGYKLDFIRHVRSYLDELHTRDEPLILTGDFNVAPEERDVYDAALMEGQIGYHPEERAALAVVRDWGFEDVFRRHHPEGGQYSWWDYRGGAFRRNLGLRIDHIWATKPVAVCSTGSGMERNLRALPKPSDHIPVWATFDYEPQR
jgi:exodeoxyribonuclease-3